MIKKPFFNLGAKPKLEYTVLKRVEVGPLKEIPLPRRAVLLLRSLADPSVKKGDRVRTGQQIGIGGNPRQVRVSTVTGTVSEVSAIKGYQGKTYTSVTVDVAGEDIWDAECSKEIKEGGGEGGLAFLDALPGAPAFGSILRAEPPPHTWALTAVDRDLLATTNQFLLYSHPEEVKQGLEHLRTLTGVGRIVLVVPAQLLSSAEKVGVELKPVSPVYPNAHPRLLVKEILGKEGRKQGLSESGVSFLGVEAVLGLQAALGKGELPVHKVLTVIDKDLKPMHVRARVGTPIQDILEALHIATEHGDRVVMGGPMTGETVYSENSPVRYDTDAILVQGKEQIQAWTNTHCVNCGECVRACPARMPVNMLVRLLENSLYQEAADRYDLLSCVECGLCSYVCEARIPLFQHIMLGKFEFARKMSAEVAHAQ